MKARLSFVRRPSAKPDPISPRGTDKKNGGGDLDDSGPPMPEPLASPEIIPRPSMLGQTSLKGDNSQPLSGSGNSSGTETPTSPNFAKARSKSILDLKKKVSSLGESSPAPLSASSSSSALGGANSANNNNNTDDGANGGVEDGKMKQVFPSSVREGFLRKKGVINTSWKKRYIVLLPHQLAYYDEQPMASDALPKGYINLASISRCEHHDQVSSMKDFTFDVVTPTRIFRLQAESAADMDAWIATISGTAANEQQILASRKRNVSHAALRTLAEQDRMKVEDSAQISHENAELRQWPTWNSFEVAAWIQTFGMGRYSQDFYNKGVNGDKLKALDDAALVELGVEEKPDRVKILTNIKKLIQETKRS